MALAVTIQTVDALGAEIYVSFNLTPTGSYPTGGDVMNFATAAADASYIGLLPAVESSNLLQIDAWSQGGNVGRQYIPSITKTGTPATCSPATGAKLKVNSAQGTFGTEHSASSYDADILADLITGFAIFTKML